jgi:hypothetical protein
VTREIPTLGSVALNGNRKTHLARCFAKTGIHSQVRLVCLLAALPAETPALPDRAQNDNRPGEWSFVRILSSSPVDDRIQRV